MYFVTDEPKLFNAESGVIIALRSTHTYINGKEEFAVCIYGSEDIHRGTRQECEDFIYSIAGYVGAVNPMSKPKTADKDPRLVERGLM